MKNKLILALISLLIVAFPAKAYEVQKTISKTFSNVKSVVIQNKYGDVFVNEWNKNEVFIEVNIKVKSKTKGISNDLVNSIIIEMDQSGKTVTGKTIHSKKNWNNVNYEVVYTINIPKKTLINIDNKYGAVKVDRAEGAIIDVGYGNVICGTLLSPSKITVAYGDLKVDSASDLLVNIKYSGMTINKANNVVLDSRYSSMKIRIVNDLVIESKYDNYEITEVSNVTINAAYTPINIRTLLGDAIITNKFNHIKIYNVGKQTKNIKLTNSFSGIVVDMGSNGYTIRANTSFGKISANNAEIKNSIEESNSTEIEGSYGNKRVKLDLNNKHGDIQVN